VVYALLVLILVAVAGCGSAAPRAAVPAAPGNGPDDATPGAPLPSPAGPVATGDFAARLPKFGPAPPPHPVPVPAGPLAPIYTRLPVDQPVAFLTIDDGFSQHPEYVTLMKAAHIRFTMFLIASVAAGNPSFFQQLAAAGGVIEDHTVTHPSLRGRPYVFQRREVCDARTSLQQTFGTTMHLFRPPFGNYDETTLQAVHDCGLRAAFYWSETVNDGTVFYQTAEHVIHAGDIILMHFRPAFVNDVIAALTAIHNAGLTPALLEDYIAGP
jgi:peptidoglycan/xylan/chitin deacetylase (PgdA/CDA1 family)